MEGPICAPEGSAAGARGGGYVEGRGGAEELAGGGEGEGEGEGEGR